MDLLKLAVDKAHDSDGDCKPPAFVGMVAVSRIKIQVFLGDDTIMVIVDVIQSHFPGQSLRSVDISRNTSPVSLFTFMPILKLPVWVGVCQSWGIFDGLDIILVSIYDVGIANRLYRSRIRAG